MGADLLLAVMKRPPELSEDQYKRVVDRHVDCLSSREALLKIYDPEELNNTDEYEGDDDALRQAVKDKIIAALASVYDTRRDVSDIRCDCGLEYIVTGGMSWGDPPTDSYDDIAFLDQIGFTDWAEKSDLEVFAEAIQPESKGLKLYRYSVYMGRMGGIEGLFAVDAEDERCLQALVRSGRELRFGEILGKHSNVSLPLKEKDIKQVEATPTEVDTVLRVMSPRGGRVISGHSPLAQAWSDYECLDAPPEGQELMSFFDYCSGISV